MFSAMQMGVPALLRSRQVSLCGLTLVALALSVVGALAQPAPNGQRSLFRGPDPRPAPPPAAAHPAPAAVSPAAAKLVVQAAQLMKARNYDEALPLLDKALSIDPKLVP